MSTQRQRQREREESAINVYVAQFAQKHWPSHDPKAQEKVSGALKRELESNDDDSPSYKDWAVPPPQERIDRLRVPLQRVTNQLSAAHRIVPRVEELALKANSPITPNMLTAAKYYACLAFLADGPSMGGSQYGEWTQTVPSWSRCLTTDQRMQCRWMFDKARFAAFGLIDRNGRGFINEQVQYALEPILLGDDACKTFGEVGEWLSTYADRASKTAAGRQELIVVARRLRDFFRLAIDDAK